MARLRHPNIVTAYTAFRLPGTIVFAMEYVEGYDLAKLVKAKGALAVPHATYFIHQAALGLQHAHEEGMVHRDIKPGNLMLSRKGDRAIIKILDFGLARANREQPLDSALTQEGQMLGTPDYIAPEQTLNAQTPISGRISTAWAALSITFSREVPPSRVPASSRSFNPTS